jgi:hypothetical protein
MYYKLNINTKEQEESVEIKVKEGILGTAEWGVIENEQEIPEQKINVLVKETEGSPEAWIQILDSNNNVISEGIINNNDSIIQNSKDTNTQYTCEIVLLDKDIPSCIIELKGLKRNCCRRSGRNSSGGTCYVRCCNSCCGGGSACRASCCP